jgi:hypothetical protein
MHQASVQHVQKREGKLSFSRQHSSRNAADRVCYDCDRTPCSQSNKDKGYKDFSHAVWDLDVGSPELLCHSALQVRENVDFGNARISVAESKNHIQTSSGPSPSTDKL